MPTSNSFPRDFLAVKIFLKACGFGICRALMSAYGFREENSATSNWWLFIFFAAVVSAVGYLAVFNASVNNSPPPDLHHVELSRPASKSSDKPFAQRSADPATVGAGKEVFVAACSSCHAAQAQGLIGPNLTDKYWIHGSTPADIAAAVERGFPEKGMPPWGPILGPERVGKVVAFVMSIRGTNVAGKAPQGSPIDE